MCGNILSWWNGRHDGFKIRFERVWVRIPSRGPTFNTGWKKEGTMLTYIIEWDEDVWRASVKWQDKSETACFGDTPLEALQQLLTQIAEQYYHERIPKCETP